MTDETQKDEMREGIVEVMKLHTGLLRANLMPFLQRNVEDLAAAGVPRAEIADALLGLAVAHNLDRGIGLALAKVKGALVAAVGAEKARALFEATMAADAVQSTAAENLH